MQVPERLGILLAVVVTLTVQKSVLLSAAKTTSCTGLKIYTSTVLTLRSDIKVFSQPFHYTVTSFIKEQTLFHPLQPTLLPG